MKKLSRLPHEQAIAEGDVGVGPEHDGLPVDGDVEGHVQKFMPGTPGTGGDNARRPINGGELDPTDDVEGHVMGRTRGERLSPGMPGTGGDLTTVDTDEDDTGARRLR